jgi:serine/threonine protein kinase
MKRREEKMGGITQVFCEICGASNPIGSEYCWCGAPLFLNRTFLVAGTPLLQNGRYIVERPIAIGEGRSSYLYAGHHTFLEHPVFILECFLLKFCTRQGTIVQPVGGYESQFEDWKSQFKQSARLLFKLSRPGIARVYDAFEENNTIYVVMEFLEGKILSHLLEERGGVMEEAEAVGYILQVAEALEVVHQAGYLYREIKPQNIFVCSDGRVMLAPLELFESARPYRYRKARCPVCGFEVMEVDMGVINVCPDCATEITQIEEIEIEIEDMEPILTPGYAPLEQYASRARFGPPLDIYALGATLYHLLTGQMPPSAPDRAQGMDLVAPHQLNPKVSRSVSEAVMKAMAIRVGERPQTVQAFIEALRGDTG